MTQHEKLMLTCSDKKTKSYMETLLFFILLFFVQLQSLQKCYAKPASKIIQCRDLVYHWLWLNYCSPIQRLNSLSNTVTVSLPERWLYSYYNLQ